jgi:hypothetical protein
MIFISYRREDTKAEVTNLHRRLVERYAEEQVFVDYNDIPPGEKWPDTLRQKLEESCVLLAIIGSDWGDAHFTTGKKKGRLRLDDPDDWVRQEICTAIRRGKEIRVVVVPIDHAKLPETEWNCELDQLPDLQHAPIRNQGDFEHDFIKLCGGLEKQIPELKRVAESRRNGVVVTQSPSTPEDPSDQAIRHYLVAELRNHASIQLPLISQDGQAVIAPINELRIDLPLIVSHEHDPIDPQTGLLWVGYEILFIHDQFRSTHTNALLVDRVVVQLCGPFMFSSTNTLIVVWVRSGDPRREASPARVPALARSAAYSASHNRGLRGRPRAVFRSPWRVLRECAARDRGAPGRTPRPGSAGP